MKRLLIVCLTVLLDAPASAHGLLVQLSASLPGSRVSVTHARFVTVQLRHEGDHLIIAPHPAGDVAVTGHAPFVIASRSADGEIILDLRPGTVLRQTALQTRTTIDLFAPVIVRTTVQMIASPPAKAVAPPRPDDLSSLVPGLPSAFRASVDQPTPKNTDVATRPTPKPEPDDPPRSLTIGAGPVPSPQPFDNAIAANASCSRSADGAVLLPFSPTVGVAALQTGGDLTLFFDDGKPLDLSALRGNPVLGKARVLMRDGMTELLLPAPTAQTVTLARHPGGWCLAIGQSAPKRRPILLTSSGAGLRLGLQSPGRVITTTDPLTGAVLLIGTDRAGDSEVLTPRRSELFALDRSTIGVIVEPFSDRVVLKPSTGGFALVNDYATSLFVSNGLVGSQAAQTGLTHILDVEPTTMTALARRLQQQLAAAARTPERARLTPRLAAAQSMIELGMTREARTLLRVAFADDPSAAYNSRADFLQTLAELSDGADPSGFTAPSLPVTDETTLWRALTQPPGATEAGSQAATITEAMPLILSYPEPLRNIAAGLAAPLLLADRRPASLAALAQLPTTSTTGVPKADGLLASGDRAGALARLALLSHSSDLGSSAGAILADTLLRTRLGMVDPKEASLLLERHRLDWRAIGCEGAVLLEEASLARRAGRILPAIQLWREIEHRFPAERSSAQAAVIETLSSLDTPPVAAALSAADFVTIVSGSTAELTAHPEVAAELGPTLADRLESLDLPARATEILRKLVDAAPPGLAAAKLGEKLASMLLEQGKLADAKAVLQQSDQPNLPSPLADRRRSTLARVLDQQGQHEAALAALGNPPDAPGQDLRATILTAAGRWHDAKLALQSLTRTISADDTLGPKQADLLLRLATAASRDADKPLLRQLVQQTNGRWPDPDQRRIFDLITAPVLSDTRPHPTSRAAASPAANGAG